MNESKGKQIIDKFDVWAADNLKSVQEFEDEERKDTSLLRPTGQPSWSSRSGTTSQGSRTMIEVTRGDILKADAEALVNTVNCVGVMGRGIAAQFKRAYPKNFSTYQQACSRHEVEPGRLLIVETGQFANPRWVINFPTKRHWRGNSRIEDIDAGLVALVADVRRLGIQSIAVPPLGCGLGGLDWSQVRPRIEQAFAALPDVKVLLFEPDGAPTTGFR